MCRNFICIVILFILSGCYHTSSFVGPAYTLTSTGNISQTSLTYGLNKKIEQNTGKSSIKYMIDYFQINKSLNGKPELPKYVQIDHEKLYNLVKSNLEKAKKILSD